LEGTFFVCEKNIMITFRHNLWLW